MTSLRTATSPLQVSLPLFELYVGGFAAAAVICLASIARAKRIKQRDTLSFTADPDRSSSSSRTCFATPSNTLVTR
jgi:hypothetical protein